MRRFFVDKGAINDSTATISGEAFRHMTRVLRLKAGTKILLADGEGHEYSGLIKLIEPDRLFVDILEVKQSPDMAGPRITLCQGVPKGDKMELILQKCTELGVAKFIPFLSERTVVRLSSDQQPQRLVRWQRVIKEAARQSEQVHIPTISAILNFAEAVADVKEEAKFLFWEGEVACRLKDALATMDRPADIAVMVGPEGGFTSEEVLLAKSHGFIPVSLGKRILRTETAGIAIAAILQFYWGELG